MRSDPFAKVVLPTKSDPVVQEEKLVWVCVCVSKTKRLKANCSSVFSSLQLLPRAPFVFGPRCHRLWRVSTEWPWSHSKEPQSVLSNEGERARERESNCNGLLAWNLQICLEMYVGGFRWASEAERGLLDVEFAEEDQKEPPLVNRGSLLSFAYCSMKKNTRQFINSKHLL